MKSYTEKQKLFQQILTKTCKTQNFYISFAFFKNYIVLLIAVSIYCYMEKIPSKNSKFKDVHTKNQTYYFFDDIINLKNFDPNKIKIDEKSYKNILIYYIEYVMIKDSKYVKIISENPLSPIINEVNGYFKEINKKSI